MKENNAELIMVFAITIIWLKLSLRTKKCAQTRGNKSQIYFFMIFEAPRWPVFVRFVQVEIHTGVKCIPPNR